MPNYYNDNADEDEDIVKEMRRRGYGSIEATSGVDAYRADDPRAPALGSWVIRNKTNGDRLSSPVAGGLERTSGHMDIGGQKAGRARITKGQVQSFRDGPWAELEAKRRSDEAEAKRIAEENRAFEASERSKISDHARSIELADRQRENNKVDRLEVRKLPQNVALETQINEESAARTKKAERARSFLEDLDSGRDLPYYSAPSEAAMRSAKLAGQNVEQIEAIGKKVNDKTDETIRALEASDDPDDNARAEALLKQLPEHRSGISMKRNRNFDEEAAIGVQSIEDNFRDTQKRSDDENYFGAPDRFDDLDSDEQQAERDNIYAALENLFAKNKYLRRNGPAVRAKLEARLRRMNVDESTRAEWMNALSGFVGG